MCYLIEEFFWGKLTFCFTNIAKCRGHTPVVLILVVPLKKKTTKESFETAAKSCFASLQEPCLQHFCCFLTAQKAKWIIFHPCTLHPLKKKEYKKKKKKFNCHFFSPSLTVSFSEESHIKWDRTKEGKIQIVQETWMWGEKPFRRHDWSTEYCSQRMPKYITLKHLKCDSWGESNGSKCSCKLQQEVFTDFTPPPPQRHLHELNRALLMSPKPFELEDGWNSAG